MAYFHYSWMSSGFAGFSSSSAHGFLIVVDAIFGPSTGPLTPDMIRRDMCLTGPPSKCLSTNDVDRDTNGHIQNYKTSNPLTRGQRIKICRNLMLGKSLVSFKQRM